MKTFRYLSGVAKITLDQESCVGCGMCLRVCPHRVFIVAQKKASLVDKDGCMECGACAMNCPVGAIKVDAGVGCAALIISRWLNRKGMSAQCC